MKRALIVTTVSGFVPQFEMNNVRILQERGFEVHYASNYNNPTYGTDNTRLDSTGIIQHQIDFNRSPLALRDNIKAYRQLMKLMSSSKYDLVHCHTPMGAVMARLVAKKTKTRPVIYTAHGFHFYQGAPIINWLIYYPIEKYISRYTDIIITINREDYNRSKSFAAKQIRYIPGVGIDYNGINELSINRVKKKQELGIAPDTKIILSAGELIKRKNYETALRAYADANLSDTVYVICGHGTLEDKLKELAYNLNIEKQVRFLGYRNDIHEIMKCADVFFFPSYQEGLSVALMEAMSCGLPVVASKIRGNVDLINTIEGGYLLEPEDITGFRDALSELIMDPELRKRMGEFNNSIIKDYDMKCIKEIMTELYGRYA